MLLRASLERYELEPLASRSDTKSCFKALKTIGRIQGKVEEFCLRVHVDSTVILRFGQAKAQWRISVSHSCLNKIKLERVQVVKEGVAKQDIGSLCGKAVVGSNVLGVVTKAFGRQNEQSSGSPNGFSFLFQRGERELRERWNVFENNELPAARIPDQSDRCRETVAPQRRPTFPFQG